MLRLISHLITWYIISYLLQLIIMTKRLIVGRMPGKAKVAHPQCKNVWKFLIHLNRHLTHDVAVSLLDIYLRKWKHISTKYCTRIVIEVLLNNEKQKSPIPISRWRHKHMWCVHPMEYYSAIRNYVLIGTIE